MKYCEIQIYLNYKDGLLYLLIRRKYEYIILCL